MSVCVSVKQDLAINPEPIRFALHSEAFYRPREGLYLFWGRLTQPSQGITPRKKIPITKIFLYLFSKIESYPLLLPPLSPPKDLKGRCR